MPLEVDKLDEEAERIRREMYPEQYTEDDKPKEDEDKEAEGDGEDEGETKPADEGVSDEGKKEGADTGDSGKKDEATTAPETKPDVWEQRYKTLKGKYDKEVPALHQSMKQLQEQIDSIKDSVVQKKADKKATLEDEKTVDPDIKYLEEEFPDIHKAVAKMLESKKQVDPELQQRIQQVESKVTVADQEKFVKDLTDACNDWTSIRDDERFTEWLNEVDDLTGAPRFQLAVLAQQSLDGKRLARFYNRFKAEILGDASAPQGKSEKDLEKHVGMPKPKSSGIPDKSGKDSDILSREDIKRFYNDAASGKFVGDAEAFKKQEARIHKAMQEGRIA